MGNGGVGAGESGPMARTRDLRGRGDPGRSCTLSRTAFRACVRGFDEGGGDGFAACRVCSVPLPLGFYFILFFALFPAGPWPIMEAGAVADVLLAN